MSSRQCCVAGCLSSLDTNANLHRFPNPDKDRELFNTWVYSVGGEILQLDNVYIYKNRRVCRIHFEQRFCCRNNRLVKVAVPTRNMPDLKTVNLHKKNLEIEYIPTHHSESDLDDDRLLAPITDFKIEVEEEPIESETKRKAKNTNRSVVVKEELPAVCERQDDIILEPKEELLSDDDLETVNQHKNYLEIEYIPAHHSESDSDDRLLAPITDFKIEVEEEQIVSETTRKGSVVVKEELPAVCERQDDIILEPKKELLSDDDLETVNQHNNYLEIEYIPRPTHHSEPDSDDDPLLAPIAEFKIEVEEEQIVSETTRKATKTNRRDDVATTSTSTGSTGPRRKTAQYFRDYRARKRAEQEKELLNRTSDSSTINVAGTSKKRKSAAEYQREYRERKKQNPQTTAGPSTSSDISFSKPRRRKTPAQYQREYRARKKAQRESMRAAKTNDSSMEIADENPSNIGDENARTNPQVPYTQFHRHKEAHKHNYIRTKCTENNFGFACSTCDRLCFKQDLRGISSDIGPEKL